MFQAVIFDLYNTIAYIQPIRYMETKQKMAAAVNVSMDLFFEIWRQYSRDNNRGDLLTVEERVARVLRELGVPANRELIRTLADYEYELQESGLQLNESSKNVLEALRDMKLRLGLISNTGFSTENAVDMLGIRRYFDCILLSYKVRALKPGSFIYQCACEELQVRPEECLYVGDGDDSEIEGALSVGMYAVLLKEEGRERISHTQLAKRYSQLINRLDSVVDIAKTRNS